MNATPITVSVAVQEKPVEYLRPISGPLNRSEEPRFGLVDLGIITFFLLFAGGVVSLFGLFF